MLSALDDLAAVKSFPVTSLTEKELEKLKKEKVELDGIESVVERAFRKVMEEIRSSYKEEECEDDEDDEYFPDYPDDFE